MNSRKIKALYLIMFIALVPMISFMSPNVSAGGSGGNYPPPATGKWTVTSDTAVWDETIHLDGGIDITGATLNLTNVVLYIGLTADVSDIINVASDAKLILRNTVIMSNNSAYHYRIRVYGTIDFQNVTLKDIGATSYSCIYISHGTGRMDHVRLINSSYYGVYGYYSDNLTINYFEMLGGDRGINLYYSENVSISNVFVNNTEYGVYVSHSNDVHMNNISVKYAEYGFSIRNTINSEFSNIEFYNTTHAGMYLQDDENITIDNVRSEKWDTIGIDARTCNNITISNAAINNGYTAINLQNANNSAVLTSNLVNNSQAIKVYTSFNTTINNFEIHDSGTGIYAYQSSVNVSSMEAYDSVYAIKNAYSKLIVENMHTVKCNYSLYHQSTSYTLIKDSNLDDSLYLPINIVLGNYKFFSALHIENTNANGNPIVMMANKTSLSIDSPYGQLILFNISNSIVHNTEFNAGSISAFYSDELYFENLVFHDSFSNIYLAASRNMHINNILGYNIGCLVLSGMVTNISINNVRVYNAQYGIAVMLTTNANISSSFFYNTSEGISILIANYLNVHENVFVKNDKAINAYGISEGTAVENVFAYNKWGVYLYNADINFSLNAFIDNDHHTNITGGTILWTNGTHGNYWSNYTGLDLNHDGIGDTAYSIQSGQSDPKPLMKPLDQTGPVLVSHTVNPTEPDSTQPVTVTITASDPSQVQTVILSYYNGTTWINVTMSFDYTTETWTATLPALPGGTNVTVVFYMQDYCGNWVNATGFVISVKQGSSGLPPLPDSMLLIIAGVAVVVVVGAIIVIKKRKK